MSGSLLSRSIAAAPRRAPRRFGLSQLFGLWRSRRALSRLDEDRLEDVGLSRDAADKEAKRPVWDVPSNWLR